MKYGITGIMTVSCWTEVEADSPEEALKIARERAEDEMVASLNASPFTSPVAETFHFQNDGVPSDLEIEDENGRDL